MGLYLESSTTIRGRSRTTAQGESVNTDKVTFLRCINLESLCSPSAQKEILGAAISLRLTLTRQRGISQKYGADMF
ncbi:hypothetical protein A6V36_13685 [Paraburkholderia ginsengiterrae]|uniref:Uncharacterized protein n=1 Tax=Paraburkholderia ginsengiterrae TaxID=1462993 RepID=A0A1A9MZ57_9BURK|nr:hypothetical protein A6V36_13685 [Paraburkholderia ginsengiterrae]OAJ52665.1 hypothetical protein A6V37_09520 [Paraburkholderia ginsengiterrae]